MYVREERNAESHHILAQDLALVRAAESYREGSGAGHGPDSGEIGRPVVFQDFPGVLFGIGACNEIKYCQPYIMAEHDDSDHFKEYGKLVRDHSLVAQIAERGADIEGKDRDHDLLDDLQNDVLELTEQIGSQLGSGPHGSKADQKAEDQSAHNGHDLGDIEPEDYIRKLPEPLDIRSYMKMGNESVAGAHTHESGEYRTHIREHDGDNEHPGRVFAHSCDRRGDKAYDYQRYAEGYQLTHDILQGNDDFHGTFAEKPPQYDPQRKAEQKPERQTL